MEAVLEEVRRLVDLLRRAKVSERDSVKARLLPLAEGEFGERVRDLLEQLKREELLEVQWEIEEVVEATTPKKADLVKPKEEPKPEPPPEDPNRPLSRADLVLAYDDPRGLVLHKTKAGPERWFATQADPRTGQPQTFELHPQEIAQLKQQLAGSPYWVLGSGAIATPKPKSPLA